MQILDYSNVWPTAHQRIPESLRAYQEDVHGISAVVHAVKELAQRAGKLGKEPTARFALCCCSDGTLIRQINQIICFGVGEIDGKPCFRWCGENNDPNGAGSNSVIASYYPYAMDPAHVAAVIVANCKGLEIFRLR